MHTDLGTVGRAIWELRRKVTFRSRTEPCRFIWMRVTESLCFLWVEHALSAAGPGSQMHNDGETEANGERSNSCHAVRLAYVLRPCPLSSPAYPRKLGREGRRAAEVGALSGRGLPGVGVQ